MVDNEKVKKAFDECWEKNGGIWYADIYKDDLKQIAKWFLMSGYSARDKEAEDEKQEMLDALKFVISHDRGNLCEDCRDNCIMLIEKHTGKPIDEVIG